MAGKHKFHVRCGVRLFSLLESLLFLCCASAPSAPAAFPCSGVVLSEMGEPVSDASIECYVFLQDLLTGSQIPELQNSVTTDREGRFVIRGAPSRKLLLMRKPGLAPAWALINEASEKEYHLVLSSAGAFSGVVLDAHKRPVADAEVWAAWAFESQAAHSVGFWESILSGPLARKCFSCRSAADGTFQITGFPKSGHALLAARKAGLASQPTTSSSESWFAGGVSAMAGRTNLQIIVEPTGSIEGRVTTAPGIPVIKGTIILVPQQETWAELPRTNSIGADGVVRFTDVAPGHYRLFGTTENATNADLMIARTYCSLRPGEAVTNITVRAAPAGTLEVLIRAKEDSKPVPEAALTVDERNFIAGADGFFRIRLAEGGCSVHVQKPRFQESTFSAKILAGQTNRIEFAIAHQPTITGVVLGPSGKPVGHAQVTGFLREPSPEFEAESKSDGTFELHWNHAYDRQITASSGVVVRDVANGLAAFVPLVRGNRHLEVTLAPGLTISGKVQDSNGEALARVRVQARCDDHFRLEFSTTSGTDGSYEIKALPPGHAYSVNAYPHGYSQTFSVPAGPAGLSNLPPLQVQPWPQRK